MGWVWRMDSGDNGTGTLSGWILRQAGHCCLRRRRHRRAESGYQTPEPRLRETCEQRNGECLGGHPGQHWRMEDGKQRRDRPWPWTTSLLHWPVRRRPSLRCTNSLSLWSAPNSRSTKIDLPISQSRSHFSISSVNYFPCLFRLFIHKITLLNQ
jgi:hypothetical protein